MKVIVPLTKFIEVQGWNRPKVISKPLYNQLEEPYLKIGFYKDVYRGPNGQDMFLNTDKFTLTFSKTIAGMVSMQHNELLDGKLKPEYEFEFELDSGDYRLLDNYKDTELYIEMVKSILPSYYINYSSYTNTTHNWDFLKTMIGDIDPEKFMIFQNPYDTVKLDYNIYYELPF